MSSPASTFGWGFWRRWLLGTTVGWVGGIIGAIVLSELLLSLVYQPEESNLIVGICIGAAIGSSQIVAVRRWIALPRGWVWGLMVGVGIPFVVADVPSDKLGLGLSGIPENWMLGLVAAAGGLISGIWQARILRSYTSKANWWILASIVFWGLAWLNILTIVPVLGAVGGGLLIWLLRSPAATEAV